MVNLRCDLNVLLSLSMLLLKDIDYCYSDLKAIEHFLEDYNRVGDELQHNDTLASWNYEIGMTQESKAEVVKWSSLTSKFSVENRKAAKSLIKDSGSDVPKSMVRQLMLIKRTASSSSEPVNNEVRKLQSKMTSIYSNTVVSNLYTYACAYACACAYAYACSYACSYACAYA